ncbi:MAG TPA: serine hydrolase domain-containing protein, partial [Anaerolineales bacterium]
MMNPATLEQDLDPIVEQAMQEWSIPGLAIAIVKDDQVLMCKGYGVRTIGKLEKVDKHTLFAIASNTKAFTAAAVGLLVQEGKLGWDDPVTKWLPWFRLHDEHATSLLTVRDLLCHRTGLGTWAGDMLQMSTYPPREVLERVRHIPPAYPFRAGYGYCNLMFIAAGMVIETVSGQSWDDFIRTHLFEPLGFKDSVTNPRFFGERTNIASPHEEIDGRVQTVIYREDAGFGAAGSICASVSDLSRWLKLQLGGGCLDAEQIVDAGIIEETHTPHTLIRMLPEEKKLFPTRHFTAYGLGWFMNDHNGRLMIRHTGGLDGMLSSTVLVPEEGLGIVVLTNKLPNMGYVALPYFILDKLLGSEGRNWF